MTLSQVNISEIKSMWVGESEKNIKGIFDDYRKMVKQSAKTPILLFNEADAIIGKRMVGAEKAVDKLENNIQNIILQEIEQLDGILIATTNLAENMDKAFERRFLYKVKFEKPDLHGRLQIWQTMIPSLNDADASFLAARYDFSGGEIENIARHYTNPIHFTWQTGRICSNLLSGIAIVKGWKEEPPRERLGSDASPIKKRR